MRPDWLGPVESLVLHVADPVAAAPGLGRLLGLERAGLVSVLDVEVLGVDDAGPRSSDVGSWGDRSGADLHAFDGHWSGLLDADDRAAATVGLADGEVALVVLYEVTAMVPVMQAFTASGVALVGAGAVAEDELVATLSHLGDEDEETTR
jgi:hypothetical protein